MTLAHRSYCTVAVQCDDFVERTARPRGLPVVGEEQTGQAGAVGVLEPTVAVSLSVNL
jgi:hypothetical protein